MHYNNNNNNNNKDFGTGPAPKRRFPTPCSFSLRNPTRRSFGKKYVRGGPKRKVKRAAPWSDSPTRFEVSKANSLAGVLSRRKLRSTCPPGCWPQKRAERAQGTTRNVKKVLRMRRKAEKGATRGPKAGAQLTKIIFRNYKNCKTRRLL